MSNALKNAAETTVHAFSDLVEDLVEGARDRIEELPPLPLPSRMKTHRSRRGFPWTLVLVAVAIAAVVIGAKRMRRSDSGDMRRDDSSTRPSAGEKTFAVS
jgi:hypothetical protein